MLQYKRGREDSRCIYSLKGTQNGTMLKYFYSFISLVLCVNLVQSDPYEKCMEMFKPEFISQLCCQGLVLSSNSTEVCQKSRMDPCAQAKCEMNKFKLIDKSGGVDEPAIHQFLDKFEQNHPKDKGMAQRVRSFCMDGQYEDYTPADQDLCYPIRFLICSYVNSMVECSNWKPSEECKKVAATAAQCRAALQDTM